MKFIDRAKKKLLDKIEEELKQVERKIHELNGDYSANYEDVEYKRQKLKQAQNEKSKYQNRALNKKELKDLETIYNFITNVPKMERILTNIKKMPPLNDYRDYPDTYPDEIIVQEEIEKRRNFYEELVALNELITSLDETEIGLESHNDTDRFSHYKKIINDFKKIYNEFLTDREDDRLYDKNLISHILIKIKYIQKKGWQEEKELLNDPYLQPIEMWEEIARYYSNIDYYLNFIKSFDNKFEYFMQLYEQSPEYFDVKYLEQVLEENNRLQAILKSKQKHVANKKTEFQATRQKTKEVKKQLTSLEQRKKELTKQKAKIEKAKSIKELGYKDKKSAATKLSIETKDYIIIPIPSNISNIADLFNKETQLEVRIDDKCFRTFYLNDVAFGNLNSIQPLESTIGAILVPVDELIKDNIDSIKNGKIGLNSSVLKIPGVKVFIEKGQKLASLMPGTQVLENSSIGEYVKDFLGEDYSEDSDEIKEHEVFKNIPSVSNTEKKHKKAAIIKCIFENLKRPISYKDLILVNGKNFSLNKQEEKDIQTQQLNAEINENKILNITSRIKDYLSNGAKNGLNIDVLYRDLLTEYFHVNKKAKAEYIDEQDTTITIKGKNISIKPMLPAKDDDIARRYTRPNEDIAYKTMKLANLVNRFAHITEKQDLSDLLYDTKNDLIERVIDLAKDNPQISLKKQFDENKMAMSVVMEVPGYNMIALHILNKKESLSAKSHKLQENTNSVVQTSTILYPGVNRDLLFTMKKMNTNERTKLLLDLDNNTFYKLIIRMGYYSKEINTREEKVEFIKSIISDEKLDKMLEEYDEIEKE